MTPYALPSTFAQLWIDTSVQVVRSTTAFWGQVLSSTPTDNATRTSTAAPWWKVPDSPATTPAAFDPFAWASIWLPPSAAKAHSPAPTNIWAPWLPPQPAPSASVFANPMELWQQAWLQNLPQLTALGASMAFPAAAKLGSASLTMWPNATTAPAAVPAPWQPVATAYRTANGHAMAAVLRTLADVVEPNSRSADIMSFWPAPLNTRH